jgi:hypothetical protein
MGADPTNFGWEIYINGVPSGERFTDTVGNGILCLPAGADIQIVRIGTDGQVGDSLPIHNEGASLTAVKLGELDPCITPTPPIVCPQICIQYEDDFAGLVPSTPCANVTGQIKQGTDGVPYSNLVTMTGVGPFTFFVSPAVLTGNAGLPPGLTINPVTGEISGTPIQDGFFIFSVVAVSTQPFCQGVQKYFIIINP